MSFLIINRVLSSGLVSRVGGTSESPNRCNLSGFGVLITGRDTVIPINRNEINDALESVLFWLRCAIYIVTVIYQGWMSGFS